MALASGFGLDFERCSPEVFCAVIEELEKEARQERRNQLSSLARKRFGG